MHKRSIISRAARLTLASSLAFAGWATPANARPANPRPTRWRMRRAHRLA